MMRGCLGETPYLFNTAWPYTGVVSGGRPLPDEPGKLGQCPDVSYCLTGQDDWSSRG